MGAPDYAIHYCVDWSKRPLADPCTCRHPGVMACPIGLKIERDARGRSAICVDADICLDCGTDRSGQVDLVDGLILAMAEMGRVFPFWARINALVDHRRDDLAGQTVPMWMAGPLGMSSADVNAARRAYRVRRAAEYMGERIARYAEAA